MSTAYQAVLWITYVDLPKMPRYDVKYGRGSETRTETIEATSLDEVRELARGYGKNHRVALRRIEKHFEGEYETTDLLTEYRSVSEKFTDMTVAVIWGAVKLVIYVAIPVAALVGFIWLVKTIWSHV